jgi:WD40 repeat protein
VVKCLDLVEGRARTRWRTEPILQSRLTALALSPNQNLLAVGSGSQSERIQILDAESGRLLHSLDGHSSWISGLAFSRDGRRLISSSADQTIRFWDTDSWTETILLRGPTDEIYRMDLAEPAGLIVTASKDGDLMLWSLDQSGNPEAIHLSSERRNEEVLPLDRSSVLLFPEGRTPEWIDFAGDGLPRPVPGLDETPSLPVLVDSNVLCRCRVQGAIDGSRC